MVPASLDMDISPWAPPSGGWLAKGRIDPAAVATPGPQSSAASRWRARRRSALGVAGVRDHGLLGHRGFTPPLFAVGIGLLVGLWLRCRAGNRADAVRIGCLAAFLVGSHGVLDALAQDRRGMLFLWPLSPPSISLSVAPHPRRPRWLGAVHAPRPFSPGRRVRLLPAADVLR